MPAITSLDLSNAKLDVDHIAAIATSQSQTARDRLGNSKLTLKGVTDSIKANGDAVVAAQAAFNPRGARVTGTIYNFRDIYTEGGIAYVVLSSSFTSVSVADDISSGNVAVYQGLVNGDLIVTVEQKGAVGGLLIDSTYGINQCEIDPNIDTFWLPDNTYNTTASSLKKRYIGPGVVRTNWVNDTFMTSYPNLKENTWHPDQSYVCDRPVMTLAPALRKAYNSGSITGVIAGDSISEVCDSFYGNAVPSLIQTMLSERLRFCKTRLVNMSLLGRSLDNLASSTFVAGDPNTTGQNDTNSFWRTGYPQRGGSSASSGADSNLRHDVWPDGTVVGKSWLNHVKDISPDFLVIAHGTNNYGSDSSWIVSMKSIWNEVQTWTKVPFIILVTPAIPSLINAASAIPATQAIADAARAMAMQYGWGLIDVNSLSQVVLKATHTDYAQRVRERNFNGWTDNTRWNVGAGMTISQTTSPPGYTSTVTTSNNISLSVRKIKSRDVDISALFTLGTSDSIVFLCARSPTEVNPGGVLVRLESMGSVLRVYSGSTVLLNISTGVSVAVGGSIRLSVRATGGLLEIWVNNTKLVNSHGYMPTFTSGAIGFGFAVGNGTISEFEFEHVPEIALSTRIIDEYLVFGGTPGYTTGTMGFREGPEFHGGDGLHHPSGDGLQRVYAPAVGRFVEEFVSELRRPVPASATVNTAQSTTSSSAYVVIPGTTVTINSPSPVNSVPAKCEITISLPYTNADISSVNGLSLKLGTESSPGATLRSWYLGGSSTDYRRVFYVRVILDIGAGVTSFHLQWQGVNLSAGSALSPIEIAATVLN